MIIKLNTGCGLEIFLQVTSFYVLMLHAYTIGIYNFLSPVLYKIEQKWFESEPE